MCSSDLKDNQPLFVVDGVIFDNSSSVVGNSAFDGSMRSASTTSNRLMHINPEDIESISVLKGPAAASLYLSLIHIWQRVRTFSVRSINECLLGYVTNGTKFHDTGIFFAAYVKICIRDRDTLCRMVRRFRTVPNGIT